MELGGTGQATVRPALPDAPQRAREEDPSDLDFRQIVEKLPAAMYVTDVSGRITYFNEAALALWGRRPEPDDRWCGASKLYWPDGTPMPLDECLMAVALKERRPVRGPEVIIERPDGTQSSIIPFPTPLWDKGGQLAGAVNVMVDVAERKQAEDLVRESERRFREIFESAGVALWQNDYSGVLDLLDELRAGGVKDVRAHFQGRADRLADAFGRIKVRDVNNYAVELYEADGKQQLLGRLPPVVFAPETETTFIEELATLWEGGRRIAGQAVVRTFKGRRLEIIFTVAFEGDRCERSLASVLDSSTQKRAERALREQTRRLALINEVARTISSNLDLAEIVQSVTDAATELTGARFGAFFHNTLDESGESYALYALSGCTPEEFEQFGFPRNLALLELTLTGLHPIRSDNILKDPRLARTTLHFGMLKGLKPVISYLAAPVVSRSGQVVGGLFFGHDEEGAFTEDSERIVAGVATHAAIAIDKAQLYLEAQIEIAKRKRAQREAERLAAVVEFSEDAVFTEDTNGVITSWNAGAQRLFGHSAEEVVGEPAMLLIPPGRHDEQPEILRRIRSGERIEHYETVRQRKDGGLVEVSMGVSAVRDETGEVVGASMIARDFSELRKAQKQQALLIDELRHRVKNTLATVQSIATQTFTRAPHDQRATFSARLHALAKAHDLLARRNWNQASIRDVVSQALDPFQERARDRIAFDGPEVSLAANKALSLAMALHELATNAAKYGALSNDAGKVRVHWEITGHAEHYYVCLRLTWREHGGPPVKRPNRRGFGTFLIERIMAGDGETALSFDPEGVVCTMSIAL